MDREFPYIPPRDDVKIPHFAVFNGNTMCVTAKDKSGWKLVNKENMMAGRMN